MQFIRFFNGSLRDFRAFIILLTVFIILMAATYKLPHISIAISVIMAFAVWYLEYRYWRDIVVPQSEN